MMLAMDQKGLSMASKKKMTDVQRARLNRRRSAARWKSKGLENKEIAVKLGVSPTTVRNDLKWIEDNEPDRLARAASAPETPVSQTVDTASAVEQTPAAESTSVDGDAAQEPGGPAGAASTGDAQSETASTVDEPGASQDETEASTDDTAVASSESGVDRTTDGEEGDESPSVATVEPDTVAAPREHRVVEGTSSNAEAGERTESDSREFLRESLGLDDGDTGDVQSWWAENSVEVDDETGELDHFLALDDKGKWDYMMDRVHNDRVECTAIAFIVVAVVVFLLSL